MEPHCCARCRLLQPPSDACRDCGYPAPSTLLDLSTPQIEGLLPISRRPAGHRDNEPLTEGLVAVGAGTAFSFIFRNPLGLLAAPVIAWAIRRTRQRNGIKEPAWHQRLAAIPAPRRPPAAAAASGADSPSFTSSAEPPAEPSTAFISASGASPPLITGTAEKLERTLGEGHRAALLIATAIHTDAGLLVRAVLAVPFWLVVEGGRRLLVSGPAWAHDEHHPPSRGVAYLVELGCPDLPISRATRKNLRAERTVIRPGDRISVIGAPRHEQLPITAGYRDALGESLRGEPGAPLWIEKHRR